MGSVVAILLAVTLSVGWTDVQAQGARPAGFELRVSSEAGAHDPKQGVAPVEVALAFAFAQPIEEGDVEGVTVTANGQQVAAAIREAGRWDYPEPRVLRLKVPLAALQRHGAALQPAELAMRFDCRVRLRGGQWHAASATYDFVAQDEQRVASQPAGSALPETAVTAAADTAATHAAPPAESASPTATVAAAAPEVTTETVAEAVLGPQGGTLNVPGQLQLRFPPGALAQPERITVRRLVGLYEPLQGVLYDIARERNETPLAAPVTITFSLPPGADGSRSAVVQEVAAGVLEMRKAQYEPTTRTVTVQTDHFSLEGLLIDVTGENITRLHGAKWGAVGGGVLVLVAEGVVGGMTLPIAAGSMVVGAAAGWFAAVPYEMADKLDGFEGPLTVTGFDVYWDPRSLDAEPRGVWAELDADGRFIRFVPNPQRGTREVKAVPLVRDTAGAGERAVARRLRVPLPVMKAASLLQGAERWFAKAGFEHRRSTIVRIHRGLGTDPTGQPFLGEWDRHTLNVDADQLTTLFRRGFPKDLLDTLSVALVHEYWHALHDHLKSRQENPYGEPFPGAEEAVAVALESLAVPDWEEFAGRFTWKDVSLRLVSGLKVPGEGEDPIRRGYDFWPFAKFLFHRQGGVQAIDALASGRLIEGELDRAFLAFVRSLLTEKEALVDREEVKLKYPFYKEPPAQSFTGWSRLSLKDFVQAGSVAYDLGEAPVPRATPLSLRLFFVRIPALADGAPDASLVVRRKFRREELNESIVVLPPVGTASELQPVESRSRLLTGIPGVSVPSKLLAGTSAARYLPVAIIGLGGIETYDIGSAEPDPLLSYRLLPPRFQSAAVINDPDSEAPRLEIRWQDPDLGAGLRPADCLLGYRLYGQKVGAREPTVVADLVFPEDRWGSDPPKGWNTSNAEPRFELEEGRSSIRLPPEIGQGFERLGLASLDGVMTEGGSATKSAIAWLQAQRGAIQGKVLDPRRTGSGPFTDAAAESIPGLKGQFVLCQYSEGGVPADKRLTTDDRGEFRLEVPLDVPITCRHAAEIRTVSCTSKASTQTVVFGGPKIQEVSTSGDPGRTIPPPPQ